MFLSRFTLYHFKSEVTGLAESQLIFFLLQESLGAFPNDFNINSTPVAEVSLMCELNLCWRLEYHFNCSSLLVAGRIISNFSFFVTTCPFVICLKFVICRRDCFMKLTWSKISHYPNASEAKTFTPRSS